MTTASPASLSPARRLLLLSTNESLCETLRHHLLDRLPASLLRQSLATAPLSHDLVLLDAGSFAFDESLALLRQLGTARLALVNTPVDRARRLIERVPMIRGVFYPDTSPNHLLKGIQTLLDGRDWLPRAIMEKLIQHYRQVAQSADALEALSARERQIMLLAGKGLSNAAIGEQLHLSTHTVKSHVHNALRKLGASNRAQGAAIVLGHSLEHAS